MSLRKCLLYLKAFENLNVKHLPEAFSFSGVAYLVFSENIFIKTSDHGIRTKFAIEPSSDEKKRIKLVIPPAGKVSDFSTPKQNIKEYQQQNTGDAGIKQMIKNYVVHGSCAGEFSHLISIILNVH